MVMLRRIARLPRLNIAAFVAGRHFQWLEQGERRDNERLHAGH
jgi:hypothetical protein